MEEDLPVLTLWTYRQFYLFDPEVVRGVSTHPRMLQHLEYLSVTRDEGGAP